MKINNFFFFSVFSFLFLFLFFFIYDNVFLPIMLEIPFRPGDFSYIFSNLVILFSLIIFSNYGLLFIFSLLIFRFFVKSKKNLFLSYKKQLFWAFCFGLTFYLVTFESVSYGRIVIFGQPIIRFHSLFDK